MSLHILDTPLASLIVVLAFAALLAAGAPASRAWSLTGPAAGLSMAVAPTSGLALAVGAGVGLHQSLVMLQRHRLLRAKLVKLSPSWRLQALAEPPEWVSGVAIIAAVTALHAAMHRVVGTNPVDSSMAIPLALALLGAAFLPRPALLRKIKVRHDPKGSLVLSGLVLSVALLAANY
jgi:hypothetical protein